MKKLIGFGALALVVVALIVGLVFVLPSYLTKRSLDQIAAGLPAGTTFTYDGVDYALLADRVTLKNAALTNADPAMTVGIGEVIVTGGSDDLDKAIAAAKASPHLDDTNETKIADRIELKNIHVKQGPVDAGIGDFVINNLRLSLASLYAPLPPLSAEATAETSPAIPDLAAKLQKAALYATATAYDSATVTDFTLDVTGARDAKILIKSFETDGFSHGDIQKSTLAGFTVQAGLFGLGIDAMAADEIDHSGFWKALRDGAALNTASSAFQGAGQTIDGIHFSNGGQQVAVIDEIKTDNISYTNGLTTGFDITLTGLHVDPARIPAPGFAATAKALGYTSLDFNGALSYRWDVEQKQITISNTSLALTEGGTLKLSALFVDADPAVKPVTKGLKLANLTLEYDDNSLVTKFLALTAARTSRDIDTVKKTFVAYLGQQQQNFTGDPAVYAALSTVKAFIMNPRRIVFMLNPPTPVGMGDLDKTQPQTFATKLGLSTKAD